MLNSVYLYNLISRINYKFYCLCILCCLLFSCYIYGFIHLISTYMFRVDIVLKLYVYTYILLIILLFNTYFYSYYTHCNYIICAYTLLLYILFNLSFIIQFFSISDQFNFYLLFGFTRNINFNSIHLIIFEFSNNDCLFSSTTSQIAFFVNLFSIFYINDSVKRIKFFFLLNLFFISMVCLIHSKNFILLFFFWEMIGISSYLLINFFYNRPFTFKSSLKAFLFNRISDLCLICSIVIYYLLSNSLLLDNFNYFIILHNSYFIKIFFFNCNVIIIFNVFVIIASFIKSAQFIFHFWLPDSMEAPVPASALIHSATLVASGIFLINKFVLLLTVNIYTSSFIIVISSFTFLFGSIIASFNSDIKKILAYSTISNCGLIILAVIASNNLDYILYFIVHGWFKSILFILSGSIINYSFHIQDVRIILNFYNLNFIKFSIIAVCILFLSSFSLFSLSFLKHSIFQNLFICYFVKISTIYGIIFSYVYSLRLLFLLLTHNNNFFKFRLYSMYADDLYPIYIYFLFLNLIIFKFTYVIYYSIDSTIINYILLYFNFFILYVLIRSSYSKYVFYTICIILIIFCLFINFLINSRNVNFIKSGLYLDIFFKKIILVVIIRYSFIFNIIVLESFIISFFFRTFFFNLFFFDGLFYICLKIFLYLIFIINAILILFI